VLTCTNKHRYAPVAYKHCTACTMTASSVQCTRTHSWKDCTVFSDDLSYGNCITVLRATFCLTIPLKGNKQNFWFACRSEQHALTHLVGGGRVQTFTHLSKGTLAYETTEQVLTYSLAVWKSADDGLISLPHFLRHVG
jgi:hypothetical protein